MQVLLRAILTFPLSFFTDWNVRQTLSNFSRDVATLNLELPSSSRTLMEKSAAFLGVAVVLGFGQAWHFIALVTRPHSVS